MLTMYKIELRIFYILRVAQLRVYGQIHARRDGHRCEYDTRPIARPV